MARSRTSARPVVVGAVLALAAALSGCSATNDITSQSVYSASDGVRATLGDLTAENLLLVAEAADAPAALQGALTNRGDDTLTVELSLEGATERVRVESGATVLLGGGAGEGGADGDEREEVVFDAAGRISDIRVERKGARIDAPFAGFEVVAPRGGGERWRLRIPKALAEGWSGMRPAPR